MKSLYITPKTIIVEVDGAGLLLQGSGDTPAQAYNQYSSDDACVAEERQDHSLWDDVW